MHRWAQRRAQEWLRAPDGVRIAEGRRGLPPRRPVGEGTAMRFVWKRLGQLVVVLFFVTFFSFLMISLLPGDPAIVRCGVGCSQEDYDRVREEMGLNRPVI